ncbi:hypothetical protein UCRPC4_g06128 [Phaeomoniella chlamydospora]|uniref:Duf1275 domain protein n=1 Tax=Phaeomoniella chlamydospora TaxID=158046 RepID=A0A0G2DZ11_PHACM|nr:hypothetical protein UCRPC4_g06128 [Phaeomoniella chlamydospora]
MASYIDLSRSPTIVNLENVNEQILAACQNTSDGVSKEKVIKGEPDSGRDGSPDSSRTTLSNRSEGEVSDHSPPPTGRMHHQVSKKQTIYILVILFFISGLVDSVAFNSWSCFVSMQTGNTIFTALGLTRQPVSNHPQQYLKSLTSIGAFCVGLQTICIIVAATLVTLGLVSNQASRAGQFSSGSAKATDGEYDSITRGNLNWLDLVPIALLAFQASGQVCLSRLLGINELPAIVLSTLYYDYMSDVTEYLPHEKGTPIWIKVRDEVFMNEKRNRRFWGIAGLFLGGLIGGYMFRSSARMWGALWLAASLKLLVVFCWVFWPGEPQASNISPV